MFSITTYIIECVIMMAVFGVLVFGMLLINPISFINDYPPEIQEEYYRSQHKEKIKKKLTVIMIIKKVVALILFAFIFAWMAHMAGAVSFVQGLFAVYGYIIVLVVFDTCILDWVLFPRIKRVRLPGTEHMDKEYHQKLFHVKAMLPMIPVFAIGGVVSALIMVCIW
ncbi:hypothetical protein CDQ84_18470 [Clostridium thermosuccinogenes]|jgi:hypothetical protein|uniref:Nitroreductase n=2 Tax=Clostridium thermosuccinogenes TaxID=84032 RepID=A0A2K2EZF9_9CLOT|nr:hypothetical protein [Pseudoclostridium thermosuccinogenes]AUS97253.1 hypothetical protein CDO33_12880 [Pseudoclostridium thermosuccinogenes]PNT91909.1 hypothetical protein CDQ85_18395 [Pseudoclostridium thermosuccinogenes]PNT94701.1 hypothetical protein CDQ84_18470 [Pseudoclostridium thermosuccinogenes]